MTQQPLDVRRAFRIVRRHPIVVGVIAGLGLAAGVAIGLLSPPMLTSKALVVITQSNPNANVATQVVIAGSDPVLTGAQRRLGTTGSLAALRTDVQVKSLTNNVLSIGAKGHTAARAEDTANAVAGSYVAYLSSSSSPVKQTTARMLEQATTASGTKPAVRVGGSAGAGLLGGILVGAIAALAVGRGDRRLRSREEIANAIGVPVVASVAVARPSDPAGWTRLLEDYAPGVVHAWRLRKALQLMDLAGAGQNGAATGRSVTVLTLAGDPGALALGPQLAVYAASLGIPTALIIGPQKDEYGTATLRTACSAPAPSPRRSRHLRVLVADGDEAPGRTGAALTVVVTVVDGSAPDMTAAMRTTLTTLGVSAGAATAEQLARAAISAAVTDHEITGILVADPEPTDQTTGRIPQLTRPAGRRGPARLTGIDPRGTEAGR